jgi:chemotaxis protein CheD
MNHFMLPQGQTGVVGRWGRTGINTAMRYGNYAMEYLLNEVLKHGGRREYLEIKMVGGGQILKQGMDVGRRNIAFVRAYLREENLPVAAEDVGDIHPRKVYYDPKSGKVRVKKLRSLHHQQLIASETRYQEALRTQPDYGEVELFE